MHGVDSFTCDWGNCNEPMVGYRLDDEHGWLPVCQKDFDAEPNPQRKYQGNSPEETLQASGVFDIEREVLGKSH